MTHSLLIVLSVLFIIQAPETFLALFQQSVAQYHQRVQRMAAPPPYDDSQKYNPGQGPPGYYPQQPGPPGNYPQDQEPRRAPAVVVVNRGPMGMFGKDPVTTTCPNCQANVRKSYSGLFKNYRFSFI